MEAKDAIKSRIIQYIEATNSATSVRDFLLKAGLSASFISGYNQWIYLSVNQQLTEGHFLTADVLADAFTGYQPPKDKKEAPKEQSLEASEHTQTPLWEVTASHFSFWALCPDGRRYLATKTQASHAQRTQRCGRHCQRPTHIDQLARSPPAGSPLGRLGHPLV